MIALKILRNFGHLIVNIHLDYDLFALKTRNWRIVEHYLAEYGSGSFIQMTFAHSRHFFENIQKKFTKVKYLHIEDCGFERELPFNRNFPNLQSLKLGSNYFRYPAAIRIHFPALTSLALHDSSYGDKNDVEELSKLNPQLEKLELFLRLEWYPQFISRIKEYCPNLQNLGLGSVGYPMCFCDGFQSTHFDKIEKFSLNNIDDMRIPFTFSRLQQLKIKSFEENIQSTDISNFIDKNQYVTSLELQLCNIVDLSHFFRINSLLLNIEELRIEILEKDIPSDSLMYFLTQNQSLKRFSLTGQLQNFRHFYNAIISRDTEFKIRSKAIEFTVTRATDHASKKYVLRIISKGSEAVEWVEERDIRYTRTGTLYWVIDTFEDNRLMECCSYDDSPHLISQKYDKYANTLRTLLKQYNDKSRVFPYNIPEMMCHFYY